MKFQYTNFSFTVCLQGEKDNIDDPCLCLSDFIAPESAGYKDYIGLFAVSAGFGCDTLVKRYGIDSYRVMVVHCVWSIFLNPCLQIRRTAGRLQRHNGEGVGGSVGRSLR